MSHRSSRRLYPAAATSGVAGLPDYEAVQWYGLLAPSEIILLPHKDSIAILRATENSQRLAGDGINVVANLPESSPPSSRPKR